MITLPEFSQEVWEDNYRAPFEATVEDTWKRLAKAAAAVEQEAIRDKVETDFLSILTNFKFIPGGRIMANLGVSGRDSTTLFNCITGDTLVHTKEGVMPACALRGGVETLSIGGVYRKAFWKSYGKQPVYKILLKNGDILKATADHDWWVSNNKGKLEKVKTLNLVNKSIPLQGVADFKYEDALFKEGIKHGLVFGDGTLQTGHKYSTILQFGDSKHLLYDWFDDVKVHYKDTYARVSNLPKEYKLLPSTAVDPSYIRGFIAGLIASDGNVDSRGAVTFFNKSEEIVTKVRELCTLVGLPTTSIKLVRTKSPFDGSYKPLYKLTFDKRFIANDKLILKNKHKNNILQSPIDGKIHSIKVISVSLLGMEEVFCCTEDETHTIVIGNLYLTGQCYVHHPKDIGLKDPDSLSGIYDMLKAQAMTLKSEGGYGINASWIRPRGMYVKGIGSRTPGVLKFMELWDKSSEVITMGSDFIIDELREAEKLKIRKGAQMLVLDIWHPEIEDFIRAKLTPNRLTKFNLSVGVTEGFMEAVNADATWELVYPDTEYKKYKTEWNGDLEEWRLKQYPIKVYKTVKAKDLWELIMKSTYTRNDPGVLFFDLFNKLNPLAYAERIFTTNPCGLQTNLAACKTPCLCWNSLYFLYYNAIGDYRREC